MNYDNIVFLLSFFRYVMFFPSFINYGFKITFGAKSGNFIIWTRISCMPFTHSQVKCTTSFDFLFSLKSRVVVKLHALWKSQRNIPILRQQMDWLGGVRNMAIFADLQYCLCWCKVGGWVWRSPKMYWHIIGMVPKVALGRYSREFFLFI